MDPIEVDEMPEDCQKPECLGRLIILSGDEWPNQPRPDRKCSICGGIYTIKHKGDKNVQRSV